MSEERQEPAILQGKNVINSADEFHATAKRICRKVNVLYIPEEKVREVGRTLQERWERSKVIPHTHALHYAERASDTHIKVARNSPFQAPSPFEVHRLLECPIATAVSSDGELPVKFAGDNSILYISVAQSNSSLTIKYGLTKELTALLSDVILQISLPVQKAALVSAIVDGSVSFKGHGIISQSDILSLLGGHAKPEDNYIVNFIIDCYLILLQQVDGVKLEVITWEEFETVRPPNATPNLHSGRKDLLESDLILIPCNLSTTEHWFLLAVFPKKYLMAVLDSAAGDYVKPSARVVMKKMFQVLKMIDGDLNVEKWKFCANRQEDIPQQGNSWDCGAFVCAYARCLVSKGKMMTQRSIPDFRKFMILELHSGALQSLPYSTRGTKKV